MDYIRFFIYIGLILSLFFTPWWCFYIFTVLYMIYYTPTYEVLFLGFLADGVFGVMYMHTCSAALLGVVVYVFRSYIRV